MEKLDSRGIWQVTAGTIVDIYIVRVVVDTYIAGAIVDTYIVVIVDTYIASFK